VKLRCAVSPRLGLKGPKIARSVTKVGVHASLSNGHPNLWSNFNSEKLVRSETPSCIFARVGLKGVQIARNIAKVGVHIFISNGHPNLWSKFNSKNLVKSETPSFDFAKVWLQGVHAYLPNGDIDAFTRVALKGNENSLERYEIWCVHFFIEMGT